MEIGYQRVLWRVYRTLAATHRALGDGEEEARNHEAAAVLRRIADTIPEGDLKNTFLSDPSVVSALTAADTRRREGGTR